VTAPLIPPRVQRRRMMLPGFEEQAPLVPDPGCQRRPVGLLDESRFQQAMDFGDQTDAIDQAMGLGERPQPTGLRAWLQPALQGLAQGLVENYDEESQGGAALLRGLGSGFLGQQAMARATDADRMDREERAQRMKLALLGAQQNERRLSIMERPEPVRAPEPQRPMVVGRSLVDPSGRVLYRDPEAPAGQGTPAAPKWDRIVGPDGRITYYDPVTRQTQQTGLTERIPGTGPNAPGNPGKTLPFAVVQDMAKNERQLGVVDEAIKAIRANPSAIGGPRNWLLPRGITNFIDREGAPARSAISDIGSLEIKDRSGAAVTATEFKRLGFIPSEDDTPEVAIGKLERFREYIRNTNAGIRDYYATQGYGTPGTPNTDAAEIVSNVDEVAAQVWQEMGNDADPKAVEDEVRRRMAPRPQTRRTGPVRPDGTPDLLRRRP